MSGIRRYLITAVDTKSKFAFSYAYSNLSSKSTLDFIIKLKSVFLFDIDKFNEKLYGLVGIL